jgi:tRNA A-37 threonylcarbamoyl transferase component Bud32
MSRLSHWVMALPLSSVVARVQSESNNNEYPHVLVVVITLTVLSILLGIGYYVLKKRQSNASKFYADLESPRPTKQHPNAMKNHESPKAAPSKQKNPPHDQAISHPRPLPIRNGVVIDDKCFPEVDHALDDFEAWRLQKKDIVYSKRLAKGAFGEVWSGTYHGEKVAIKWLLHEKRKLKSIKSFIEETKLMSRLDSPHIVRFIGAIWSHPSRLRCVMEFMDAGDLKDVLRAHTNLDWHNGKLDIAISVVHGLGYLHERNIIHRDLKSRNVIMDSKKGSKLSDFGVSREETHETMTQGISRYI